MSRWSYTVIVAVSLLGVACNAVESESPDATLDAAPPDASPPDAPPQPSLPPGTIVAVHHVLDFAPGGSEVSGQLENASSRLLVIASASAQRSGAGSIGVAILVDGRQEGVIESATNESASPKALCRTVFALDLAPGKHVVSILAQAGTTLAANDFVDITVLELGADARAVPLFINQAGIPGGSPLFSANLETGTGAGVLFVAGTGFTPAMQPTASPMIGVSVLVDDAPIGQVVAFTNEPLSHKAFVPAHFVLAPGAGVHRVALDPINDTVINQHDRINALWLELGSDAVATSVMAARGALPVTGTLTTRGGPVLFVTSGSGYRRDMTATGIGSHVRVSDTVVGRGLVHTAEIASHKTFVATASLVELPAGEDQSITVVPAAGTETASDVNDYYNVTAIELGR